MDGRTQRGYTVSNCITCRNQKLPFTRCMMYFTHLGKLTNKNLSLKNILFYFNNINKILKILILKILKNSLRIVLLNAMVYSPRKESIQSESIAILTPNERNTLTLQ